MEKEVMIHIQGIHSTEDGKSEEPIGLTASGEYYFRGGRHYLRYEEFPDDSGTPVLTYVKLSPGRMEVRKRGQIDTCMVFEQGKRSRTQYASPFGTIRMGIFTRSLTLTQTARGIAAEADYTLETEQGLHIADCRLTILAEARSAARYSETVQT